MKQPPGFRLPIAASQREWNTGSGLANFIVFDHHDALARREPGTLLLATIRSHDQYNTTIYGKNDRYRGITGRRDVVFLNELDLAARGLEHGELVDIEASGSCDTETGPRTLHGFVAVAYDIARGSAAAYFPEANHLVHAVVLRSAQRHAAAGSDIATGRLPPRHTKALACPLRIASMASTAPCPFCRGGSKPNTR